MALHRYQHQKTGNIVLSFDDLSEYTRLPVYGVETVQSTNSFMLDLPMLDSIPSIEDLDAQLRAEDRVDQEIAVFQDIRKKL